MKDMQPPTRQRALALVQALNKVKFETNKSISEQLPQFELMVREYDYEKQFSHNTSGSECMCGESKCMCRNACPEPCRTGILKLSYMD